MEKSTTATQDWFFTFGADHAHPNGYVKIHGTSASTREEMVARYASKWSMQYDVEAFEGMAEKYGLHEVNEGSLRVQWLSNWAIQSKVETNQSQLNGARALPFTRDELGHMVRQAWVKWAQSQPNPKPSWLLSYDELGESDKEADRQIGEFVSRLTLIADAARHCDASSQPTTEQVQESQYPLAKSFAEGQMPSLCWIDHEGTQQAAPLQEVQRQIRAVIARSAPTLPELSDDEIVKVLHSLAIDTYPSVYGFPELQVSATNVPMIRKIVGAYIAASISKLTEKEKNDGQL